MHPFQLRRHGEAHREIDQGLDEGAGHHIPISGPTASFKIPIKIRIRMKARSIPSVQERQEAGRHQRLRLWCLARRQSHHLIRLRAALAMFGLLMKHPGRPHQPLVLVSALNRRSSCLELASMQLLGLNRFVPRPDRHRPCSEVRRDPHLPCQPPIPETMLP